ncbi:endothelial cell-selective adhesion molecule-like [Tenrec ecaudatus]|uniref:endothelial cell-selective adhesion molecule-like n=1 Tax=Tenrec ecaudatus TaxID=94439 RepID=UPI003F590726
MTTSRSGWARTLLPGPSVATFLQFLFLGLSALASPSRAQLELHVPAGLSRVQAVEGSEVVLPMWYTLNEELSSQPGDILWFIWFLLPKGKEMHPVLYYYKENLSSNHRVSLVYSIPSRNLSLRLQDVQEEDAGSYRCSVILVDSQHKTKGNSSKSLDLNVLVPPASPSCHLQGVPRVGNNVTLSCQSPRSKPAAKYQWERLLPSSQVFYTPVLDPSHGSLRLTNLSPFMSGLYVCKAHNIAGSAECNVVLELSTGPEPAVVAGAVVGTLIGLGLLAALVVLYLRRNNGLEEPANDIKEDAIVPKTLPWPKGSDTLSKNGTLSSVTSARALRPPHGPPRPGTLTPTPSLSTQALPSPRLPRTDEAHLQPGSPSPGRLSSSALGRMGPVAVMPARNQAGSLV